MVGLTFNQPEPLGNSSFTIEDRSVGCCGGLEAAEAKVVLEEEDVPEDRSGKEEGVDAVEYAAVSGEHSAGVFDACSALDGGLEEVAELSGDIEDCGQQERLPEWARRCGAGCCHGR